MHDGHRQRLKKRFLKYGLDGFEDHQALELLLFYALPRMDTNELAHTLLNHFGSLRNLFEADTTDLVKVSGIGEHSAILVKLIPALASRYWFTEGDDAPKIVSIESAVEFCKSLLYGKPVEYFFIICLDAAFRVKATDLLSKGTPSQTTVYIRHIAEAAIRSGADKIIIAHNHPGGDPAPSSMDVEVTMNVSEAMQGLGIQLIDHIIISDGDFYSFLMDQRIRSNFTQEDAQSAHYQVGLMKDVKMVKHK